MIRANTCPQCIKPRKRKRKSMKRVVEDGTFKSVPTPVRGVLSAMPNDEVAIWYWSTSMNGEQPSTLWASTPDAVRVMAAARELAASCTSTD